MIGRRRKRRRKRGGWRKLEAVWIGRWRWIWEELREGETNKTKIHCMKVSKNQ